MRLKGQVPLAGDEMHRHAPGFEHAPNLHEIFFWIAGMLQDACTHDDIEALVIVRQAIGRDRDLFETLRRTGDARRFRGDGDIASMRVISARDEFLDELAGSATEIQDANVLRAREAA